MPRASEVFPEERDRRQAAVHRWAIQTFGQACAGNPQERIRRFLEEALELAQAVGMGAGEAHAMVDYVFARPVGEVHQEVGGVSVSLLALCENLGLSAHAEEVREVTRVLALDPVALRAKQQAKHGAGVAGQCSAPPVAGAGAQSNPGT